jgi:hypothetical protein
VALGSVSAPTTGRFVAPGPDGWGEVPSSWGRSAGNASGVGEGRPTAGDEAAVSVEDGIWCHEE